MRLAALFFVLALATCSQSPRPRTLYFGYAPHRTGYGSQSRYHAQPNPHKRRQQPGSAAAALDRLTRDARKMQRAINPAPHHLENHAP